jgi:flagellar biosynthesis protein FliQ
MDQSIALDVARQGMQVALLVSLPILSVSLFVGLLVSVFQAITQVQEMTLTFVPKVLGIGAVLALLGGWMLTSLVAFTNLCFEQMGRLGQ